MKINNNVLETIGNTPLVELQKVAPPGSGRVVAKLEWANPTGSMKDRMAKAAIERAELARRARAQGVSIETLVNVFLIEQMRETASQASYCFFSPPPAAPIFHRKIS